MRPTKKTIVTTVTDAFGTTLALYREAGLYVVGTVSSHHRLYPLGDARFTTYDAAHIRLEHEQRQRRAQETTARAPQEVR